VIIYSTFIGCSASIKRRSMIRIDATVQIFRPLRKPLTVFSYLATLVFCGLLIVYGWKMAALQLATNQQTIILQIPLVWLYAILPLTGATMLIRTLQVLYEDFVLKQRLSS
jgi:TRAP-type C4-dicarboxylate transport system permease small subunit